MEFVDLKAQFRAYRAEIETAFNNVLSSARFVSGAQVNELEERLAAFVGRRRAVACASGTDALYLALLGLGIGPGDEVITTPFTFIATVETILLAGARPVFVDIEPDRFNLDPARLEAALSPRTRALVAVDLYGHPAAWEELEACAAHHGLALIEDAAQSLGAEYHGRRCGAFGRVAATSFFPAKPLGCYGDGGMLFTDDEDLAERFKLLRNHGQKERYRHELVGLNSRLDTLQAAVLLAKLPHFEREIELRHQVAARYDDLFREHFVIPDVAPGCCSVFAQYTLRVADRPARLAACEKAGIPVAVHYPIPLHLQPVCAFLGYREGDFPVAEKAAAEVLSLPMHPFLKASEQQRIAEVLKRCSN